MLQKYLRQIDEIKEKINELINEEHKVFITRSFYWDETFLDYDEEKYKYKPIINYKLKYYLITLTLDPKISVHIDQYGQFSKLNDCLSYFKTYTYYACFEKHKSGILHAHILTDIDYHKIQCDLHKIKKIITKSIKLEPAINIKPVRSDKDDIDRSFDYIFDHKNDHPKYKYIKINI